MLRKNIKYTDYNGVEREEPFYFHLTKAELMELEMGYSGCLQTMLQHIIDSNDGKAIIETFKNIILKAYGEKSADGKMFRKVSDAGVPLSIAFSQTEAYSELFMELSTDADSAAKFVQGIMPSDIEIPEEEIEKIKQGQLKSNE